MIKRKKNIKTLEGKNKDSRVQRKNIRLIADLLLETVQVDREPGARMSQGWWHERCLVSPLEVSTIQTAITQPRILYSMHKNG